MTQFKIPTLDISRFENDKQNFAVELGKSWCK